MLVVSNPLTRLTRDSALGEDALKKPCRVNAAHSPSIPLNRLIVCAPESVSHIRIARSLVTEASFRPSGDKTMCPLIFWPLSSLIVFPVAASFSSME